MSGGDGMDSSTQVHVVRSMWVPTTPSYYAKHLMSLPFVDPTPIALPSAESPRVWLLRARARFKPG
jgi:hypothetical protein